MIYTITLDDYVAFCMHTLKRSPSMKWRIRLGWASVPLACWLLAALLVTTIPVTAAMLAAGGLAYAVIYPLIYPAWVSWTISAYARDLGARGIVGDVTLILAEDTLTERTESVQSIVRWQDIEGVEVVGDYTYIYITGLLAAITLRGGFDRAEDYEAVRDFALAKLARCHARRELPEPKK